MNEQEIADGLYGAAEQATATAGRHFGEGANHDLKMMTSNAAATLALMADPEEQMAAVKELKVDVVRLIQMALEEARSLTDYPHDLLGERTYFAAKLRFCPCPPLC